MKKGMKKWCENNFYYLLMIFLVIVGWTITLTSMAIGQETLDAVIKDGKIIVYKTTRIQTEIIPLPDKELGISDEDAKKVCLSAEKKITVTKEIDKKLNFFSFPFVKTKTVVEKEISYNSFTGWQNRMVSAEPAKISEKMWLMSSVIAFLFFYFIFTSIISCKKRNEITNVIFKKNDHKRVDLLFSYLCVIIVCLLATSIIATHSGVLEGVMIILICLFGFCATFFIIVAQTECYGKDLGLFVVFSGIISVTTIGCLAVLSAKNNSATEFMLLLVGMMLISFFVGCLSEVYKKKNRLMRKKARVAIRNTSVVKNSNRAKK